MANGRAIKRGLNKAQAQGAPQEPGALEGMGAPQGAGGDMSREEFMAGAEEGSSYTGRAEHLMGMMDPQQMQDIDPAMMEQLETVNAAMLDMMYSPKTKAQIQKTLQGGQPEITVPSTVNMVMSRFEDVMRQKNGELPLEMKLAIGVNLFGEVADLASTMGVLPQQLDEAQTQQLLQQTMQQYIHKGLKEKTIDPIELQLAVEPLLTPEEQAVSRGMSQDAGVPQKPTREQNTQTLINTKMAPLKVQNAQLNKSNQQLSGALQGVANSEQEGA